MERIVVINYFPSNKFKTFTFKDAMYGLFMEIYKLAVRKKHIDCVTAFVFKKKYKKEVAKALIINKRELSQRITIIPNMELPMFKDINFLVIQTVDEVTTRSIFKDFNTKAKENKKEDFINITSQILKLMDKDPTSVIYFAVGYFKPDLQYFFLFYYIREWNEILNLDVETDYLRRFNADSLKKIEDEEELCEFLWSKLE